MGHCGSCSCLGVVPRGSEEGVLDLGLPVVLPYDRCEEDVSARQLWQGEWHPGVCVFAGQGQPYPVSDGYRGARLEKALDVGGGLAWWHPEEAPNSEWTRWPA